MDCASAREILWPERPQLVAGNVLEARVHVESCPTCQDYLHTDQALTRLYERTAVEPPPALRERVFERLAAWRTRRAAADKPSRSRPKRLVVLAAATLVLAASAALAFATLAPEPEPEQSAFIDDYMRRAVSQERITTSDPEAVARFIARELGRPARPMTSPALVLKSAEICLLDGVRGAMIQYDHDGRVISHYIVPAPSARGPRPATPARTDGPAVVTWSAATFEQALIADLPPDSLLSLARAAGAPAAEPDPPRP